MNTSKQQTEDHLSVWIGLGCLLLAGFYIRTVNITSGFFSWDAQSYYRDTVMAFQNNTLNFNPETIYLHAKPLYIHLLLLLGDLFNHSELHIILTLAVFSTMNILMAFVIARRLWDDYAGLFAACNAAFLPVIALVSRMNIAHDVEAFVLLSGIYVFLVWVDTNAKRHIALSGLLIGLGGLLHPTAILYSPFIFVLVSCCIFFYKRKLSNIIFFTIPLITPFIIAEMEYFFNYPYNPLSESYVGYLFTHGSRNVTSLDGGFMLFFDIIASGMNKTYSCIFYGILQTGAFIFLITKLYDFTWKKKRSTHDFAVTAALVIAFAPFIGWVSKIVFKSVHIRYLMTTWVFMGIAVGGMISTLLQARAWEKLQHPNRVRVPVFLALSLMFVIPNFQDSRAAFAHQSRSFQRMVSTLRRDVMENTKILIYSTDKKYQFGDHFYHRTLPLYYTFERHGSDITLVHDLEKANKVLNKGNVDLLITYSPGHPAFTATSPGITLKSIFKLNIGKPGARHPMEIFRVVHAPAGTGHAE